MTVEQEGSPRAARRREERSRRWLRRAIVAAVAIAVGVALWIWVFPWVDKTYVNRPQISGAPRRHERFTQA